MILVDSHCHLYLREFENDIEEIITKARNAGVARFYLPSISSDVIDNMLNLEALYPGECFPMMGLHPCSVNDVYKKEIKIIEDWLLKRRFVAIGEIGLDFYWDKTFADKQYEAFNLQMELALQHNLPIVIHTRNAMQQTIDAVKPFAARGLRGIFHCFSGDDNDAVEIVNMGFYLGIGGVLTYKNSGLAAALQNIDLKHMVLETDAPYLAPVPFRGKRNESSYIKLIAEKLAEVKGVSVEEVAKITTANANHVFGFVET